VITKDGHYLWGQWHGAVQTALQITGTCLCECGRRNNTLPAAHEQEICVLLLILVFLLNNTVIMCLSCYMSTGNPACLPEVSTLLYWFCKQARMNTHAYTHTHTHMRTHALTQLGSTKCYAFLLYLKCFWSTIKLNYYTTKYSDLNKGITRRFMSCDI